MKTYTQRCLFSYSRSECFGILTTSYIFCFSSVEIAICTEFWWIEQNEFNSWWCSPLIHFLQKFNYGYFFCVRSSITMNHDQYQQHFEIKEKKTLIYRIKPEKLLALSNFAIKIYCFFVKLFFFLFFFNPFQAFYLLNSLVTSFLPSFSFFHDIYVWFPILSLVPSFTSVFWMWIEQNSFP